MPARPRTTQHEIATGTGTAWTKSATRDTHQSALASSAVVTGRGVGDLLGAGLDLVILALAALVVGWRPDGGPAATLAQPHPGMPRQDNVTPRGELGRLSCANPV
jgi:hypothetical protein